MAEPSLEEERQELFALVDQIQTAMLTTRRPDGHLVSRPMRTQRRGELGDFWFVTSSETHKLDEVERDPHVNLAYLNERTHESVSVTGIARIVRDRGLVRRLHDPSWRAWVEERAPPEDGGPDDPRYVLIVVEPAEVSWYHLDRSDPRALLGVLKDKLAGEPTRPGRVRHLRGFDLQ